MIQEEKDSAHNKLPIWQCLPIVSAPMPYQMALDELLFFEKRNLMAPILMRAYYSSEPWMTVGYAGGKRAGYDFRGMRRGQTPVCRRLTGGGAVLHGEDVILSILGQVQEGDEKFASLQSSYYFIHEAIRRALLKMGIETSFYRQDEQLPNGRDCFLFPVISDLRRNGKKIAGGAQKRSRGFFLHQESIQMSLPLEPIETLECLKNGFAEIFGIRWAEETWDPEILSKAKGLALSHYTKLN